MLGTDSQIHEPINLSQATRQDSLRWSFVRIRRDLLSVHKAGPIDELAEIRGSAPDPAPRRSDDPVRGDPFAVFAHFATQAQSLDMQISTRSGPEEVQALSGVLDQAFTGLQATPEECEQIIELIATGGARTVREVLVGFPVPRRRAVEFAIPWLAKLGLIDWLQ